LGPFSQQIIEETEEDLNAFVAILEELGIAVKRPETWPHEPTFSEIHWKAEGFYNYYPRDIMRVIGDRIIEIPNVIRSRAQETFSYRTMMVNYLKSGAKWYSAPKPMLLDSLFEVDLDKSTPRNDEPASDAASLLRLGQDLIYLVVVDQDQTALIRLLGKRGLDVVRLKLRHAKMLGGGLHCITLAIRRTITLQRFFRGS
jgi:N-dimethylarginine dimethylaminohydrolase